VYTLRNAFSFGRPPRSPHHSLCRSKWISAVKQRGTYYLEVAGIGRSWDFAIAPDVYGFEFPGYKHDACHLEGAYHATSGKSGKAPSTGGWHDAGDYGRYMVNAGVTTGTLLWTYELYSARIPWGRPVIRASCKDIIDGRLDSEFPSFSRRDQVLKPT
jgi:hypothetical protein